MKLLYQPVKILIACLCFIVISLLMNGSLFQLYRLHRDEEILRQQIHAAQIQVRDLDVQMKQAKDPVFIERQALENYDLVDENDLVFVFSEE